MKRSRMYDYHHQVTVLFVLTMLMGCPELTLTQGQTVITATIDPQLRYLISQRTGRKSSQGEFVQKNTLRWEYYKTQGDSDLSAEVFIKTNNPESISPYVHRFGTIAGEIVTAVLPLVSVESLARHQDVQYIALSSPCRPLLDVSVQDIGAHRIWTGELGSEYKGENVIIGMIDSGIDWSHPGFIAENDQSRILSLWDQWVLQGPSPADLGFYYGTEYSRDQINDELDGTTTGIVLSADIQGHGTHTTGIAAGNGRSSDGAPVYQGVAPESDLIIVKSGDAQFLSTKLLDGVSYIAQRAETHFPGRPVVINMSVGQTHLGPHDGSSLFEQGMDNLIGEHTNLRSIVVAAGNEGDDSIHFCEVLTGGALRDSVTIEFCVPANHGQTEDYVQWDVWSEPAMDLSVLLISPSGARFGPVGLNSFSTWETTEGDLFIDNASAGVYEDNRCNETFVRLSDGRSLDMSVQDNLSLGTWQLRFFGHSGRIDGWLYESSVSAFVESNVALNTLVGEPGNAYWPIAVGSYISRIEWPNLLGESWGQVGLTVGQYSSFSSPGPTRPLPAQTSRQKPEISAPGEMIVSALSSMADPPDDLFVTPDSLYRAWSGTSMAAPHVTGVVALMLCSNPSLTVSEIRGFLFQTGKTDMYTGEVWNAIWGYGKINAFDAVDLGTSVQRRPNKMPSEWQLFQNHPNPFNAVTNISVRVPLGVSMGRSPTIHIHDIRGRIVRTFTLDSAAMSGTVKVTWNGKDESGMVLPAGLYIYRLNLGSVVLSRKMLYIK